MFKKMSFILLIFTFSQLSYSQVNYGIKAGVNYSNFGFYPKEKNSYPDDYYNYTLNYQTGIFSIINLNNTFSLDPEY